jgi:hypothetical protein
MKTICTSLLLIIFTFSVSLGSLKIMAQPANDLIENAIDLGIGPIPYMDANVDFPSATNIDDITPGPFCEVIDPGVWYTFKATAIGIATAEILNPDDAIVVFFTGPENATSGQELLFVDQPTNICNLGSLSSIETSIGFTYYIYLHNIAISDALINVDGAFASPANDLIENAIDLNGLEDFFDPDVHFLIATNNGDNGQAGCDTNPVKAVWYKFTATIDGQVVAGIDVAPAGGGVVFYTAPNENVTSGSELTWVDQPTNPCGTNNLSSIDAVAGTTYYLLAAKIGPFATGYADVSVNLSGILGVTDKTMAGFSYYPNPVSGEINLSARTILNEVTIFNVLGQKVVSEKPNSAQKVMDLSFLQTGLYVMHISSEGNSAIYKIVKK